MKEMTKRLIKQYSTKIVTFLNEKEFKNIKRAAKKAGFIPSKAKNAFKNKEKGLVFNAKGEFFISYFSLGFMKKTGKTFVNSKTFLRDLKRIEEEEKISIKSILNGAGDKTLSLEDKVYRILEIFPETRESDIELTIKIWKIYYPDCIEGLSIKIEALRTYLPSQDSIKKIKMEIQNKKKLFLSSGLKTKKEKKLQKERS